MGNDSASINSLHVGNMNKDDVMDITGERENNTDEGGSEKEKQSTADQHMQELAAMNKIISIMQVQMESLECIITTQHNYQQTNVTIVSIDEIQQLSGGSVAGVSAGIAPSPLTGAQGAQALQGQESKAASGDDHKPG